MCRQLRAFWDLVFVFLFFWRGENGISFVNARLFTRRHWITADSGYHGKADICLLEGGAVIGPVSRHCHHLSGFAHRAVDDT